MRTFTFFDVYQGIISTRPLYFDIIHQIIYHTENLKMKTITKEDNSKNQGEPKKENDPLVEDDPKMENQPKSDDQPKNEDDP